ncbi:MAG: DVUA0089 family protein, partial [Chloroflexi bacterium]|nr:DVUA0089 family protein [Chloroflexota bacterium]
VQYRPTVTWRLEWRSNEDWRATIVDAERYDFSDGLTIDPIGSWERRDGSTMKSYDASFEHIGVQTWETVGSPIPPGGYLMWFYSDAELGTRTDGDLVSVETDICTGDECNAVPEEGAVGLSSTTTMGRRFTDEDDPGLSRVVFTNDKHRIPLRIDSVIEGNPPDMEVLELQVMPVEPEREECQTNLRTVFVREYLGDQKWDEECLSSNRPGANAHFYTFTLDKAQTVTIEADSPGEDLYLYLMSGAGAAGTVLAENDNLKDGAPSTPGGRMPSGITRRMEAGTYTVEVTTNATEHSSDEFQIGLRGEAQEFTVVTLSPTPTPTPDPYPCTASLANRSVVDPMLVLSEEVGMVQVWRSACYSVDFPTYHAMYYPFSIPDGGTTRLFLRGLTNHDDFHMTIYHGSGKTGEVFARIDHVGNMDGDPITTTETLPPGQYTLQVWALEPGDEAFTLLARPVNRPPVFAQPTFTFSVPDNSPNSAILGRVSATDPDGGDAVRYAIQDLPSSNAPFEIDYHLGDLVLFKKLDYETEPTITLTVQATDKLGLTDTATVTINVTDVAEATVWRVGLVASGLALLVFAVVLRSACVRRHRSLA